MKKTIIFTLIIFISFANTLKASIYSDKCKDRRIKEDSRELAKHEYTYYDLEGYPGDSIDISNLDYSFDIKRYEISFRKLGSDTRWKGTETFYLSMEKNESRNINLPNETTEIFGVKVWSKPYDNCFAYYTKKELKEIAIAKELVKTKKEKERKLRAEKRKKEQRIKEENRKIKAELKRKQLIKEKKQRELLKKLREKELKIDKKIEEIENASKRFYIKKRTVIYENCVIDKLKPNSSKELEKIILSKCKRISKNPNWWEAFWYDKLNEKAPPKRGYLGVFTIQLDKKLEKKFNLKPNSGILITSVTKDSSAYNAGIQEMDIIVKFNNIEIPKTDYDFRFQVASTPAGTKVPIELLRDGKKITVTATLGTRIDYRKNKK